MTASTYDEALRRLFVHEGGYTNHPSDPGGPTNFGITIGDYRRYVKPDATAADVRAMRIDEAKTIYRSKYWNALRCDALPAGLDYALFDYGVNSGTSRAAKVLQRVLNFPDDGRMTDALLAAVRKRPAGDLIVKVCDERLAFLKRLKTWPVFGAGWGRRVGEVRAVALAMAKGQSSATQSNSSAGKGAVPVNKTAQRGTVGGIAAGGATAAQQAHHAGMRPAIVMAILIVAVGLAIAGWLWWRARQKHQQDS
jgi:lysozyme family protein